MEAFLSILEADGVRGLFVGGREQLIREIPFNAIQFTVYEVRRFVGHLMQPAPSQISSSKAT